MGKYSACRTLLGAISPKYLNIPLYDFLSDILSNYDKVFLHNMDEDGEAAAEEKVSSLV